jgi:hypothetical protein
MQAGKPALLPATATRSAPRKERFHGVETRVVRLVRTSSPWRAGAICAPLSRPAAFAAKGKDPASPPQRRNSVFVRSLNLTGETPVPRGMGVPPMSSGDPGSGKNTAGKSARAPHTRRAGVAWASRPCPPASGLSKAEMRPPHHLGGVFASTSGRSPPSCTRLCDQHPP